MRNFATALRSVLTVSLSLLWAAMACLAARAEGLTLHVAPNGNDGWSGRLTEPKGGDGPFFTLQRARDEIRKIKKAAGLPAGGIVVELERRRLRAGLAVDLSAEDSGADGAPILSCADRAKKFGSSAAFGSTFPASHRSGGTGAARRVGPRQGGASRSACAGSHRLRRRSTGEQSPGVVLPRQADDPGPLAQRGLHRTSSTCWAAAPVDVHGTDGRQDRPLHLRRRPPESLGRREGRLAPRLLVLGLGRPAPAGRVDRRRASTSSRWRRRTTATATARASGTTRSTCCPNWTRRANGISTARRACSTSGRRRRSTRARSLVSVLPTLVNMESVSHVTLPRPDARGLPRHGDRGRRRRADVQIVGCTIRNTGSWAVALVGHATAASSGCDIYETGDGGISLDGGDRKTLTAGRPRGRQQPHPPLQPLESHVPAGDSA